MPFYNADQARLSVFRFAGRWFATWVCVEEILNENLGEEDKYALLNIVAEPEKPYGIDFHGVCARRQLLLCTSVVDAGQSDASHSSMTAEEAQEARILGQALAALRVSRAMTQRQVAEAAKITPHRLCKAEKGHFYPRRAVLNRILAAMGVSHAALHRAQELVQDPMGEGAEPIDVPDFTPEEARQAAVKLSQEAGKAVAHCCLAFLEMGANGWRIRGAGRRS